jgi:hypothetical protein
VPSVRNTRTAAPLPVNTAILSNIAVCLLLWNVILRIVSLLVAA